MVCIAKKQYSANMIKHLSAKEYRVTKLASIGGFLKQGNDTLLIGVRNEDVEQLQEEMKKIVLAFEKGKGWKTKENRYTSFIIKGQNYLPIIAMQKQEY